MALGSLRGAERGILIILCSSFQYLAGFDFLNSSTPVNFLLCREPTSASESLQFVFTPALAVTSAPTTDSQAPRRWLTAPRLLRVLSAPLPPAAHRARLRRRRRRRPAPLLTVWPKLELQKLVSKLALVPYVVAQVEIAGHSHVCAP